MEVEVGGGVSDLWMVVLGSGFWKVALGRWFWEGNLREVALRSDFGKVAWRGGRFVGVVVACGSGLQVLGRVDRRTLF